VQELSPASSSAIIVDADGKKAKASEYESKKALAVIFAQLS
jgi:hypothetical protein